VHDYDDELRTTTRLRFGIGTQSMAHLQFVLPSPALAHLADPWAESVRLRREGHEPTLEAMLADVTARIREALGPLVGHIPVGRGAGSTAWYTLAPALLDGDNALSVEGFRDEDDEDTTALDRHLTELERLLAVAQAVGTTPDDLPPVPADLAEVLALRSLAGPPTVLLRAFERAFPSAASAELVAAAAYAAEGFRSLFNSTEANQALDAFDGPGEYWLTVLRYCAEGNLQAVVDELCSVLVENRGYDRAPDQAVALTDLAKDVRTTLGLSALYRPAVVTDQKDGAGPRWRQLRLRGRFALRYGTTSTEEKAEQRAADVGLAFNSPFWPFILASTSVGQEGLDFHQYAHAVSHWNLPGNPVDLEQREGRIHRYKGHAVRKNVARALPFPVGEGHPWTQLIDAAAARPDSVGSDVVPYWVFAPASLDGERAMIERHLPLTPFTREKSVIGSLLSSVVHYRLAFGQPRQDELVRILSDLDPETRAALGRVRVDLTPPRTARHDAGAQWQPAAMD
jgi:Helicase conserved C-terminal domain